MSCNFWKEADDKHRKIARNYYENIEYQHPNQLSGRSPRALIFDDWYATSIKYPSYGGPSVNNI